MKTIRRATILLLSGLLSLSQPVYHTAFAQEDEIPDSGQTAEPVPSGEPEESPDAFAEPEMNGETDNAQEDEVTEPAQPADPGASGEPEPALTEGNENAQEEEPAEQETDREPAEEAGGQEGTRAEDNNWSLDIVFFDSDADTETSGCTEHRG